MAQDIATLCIFRTHELYKLYRYIVELIISIFMCIFQHGQAFIYRQKWLEQWKTIQILVQFWCGDMVSMYGETPGRKLKACKYTVLDILFWSTFILHFQSCTCCKSHTCIHTHTGAHMSDTVQNSHFVCLLKGTSKQGSGFWAKREKDLIFVMNKGLLLNICIQGILRNNKR